jgi:predicted ribosomally synthesized peptide with SipW-like signal peptide
MTSDKKLYSLSRRKMLAGLGAVGVASVGAGLGTSALFSDTESFTGNTLTAGTLDMSVTGTVVAANAYWAEQPGVIGASVNADGEPVVGIAVDDVKPGDWGIICLDVEIEDNPGYLRVRTENFEETGGANPEPEQETEGDADNDADLGEFLLVSGWQMYDDSGTKAGLSYLDPAFNNQSNSVELMGNYEEPDNLDGIVDTDNDNDLDGDDVVHYTNAREVHAAYSGGFIARNNDGSYAVVGNGDPDASGDEPDAYRFYLLFEIPTAVGNVIQGDTVSFDLVFETEQVRNNPIPFDGDSAVSTPTPTPAP